MAYQGSRQARCTPLGDRYISPVDFEEELTSTAHAALS
jgi:hypothetical protein